MQLDRTEIVVRTRSLLELMDLSLLVLKRHALAIAVSGLMLGLPLVLLDVWVVAWMLSEDTLMIAEQLESPLVAMRLRHAAHLVLLFLSQFQLISLPISMLLGNQIFYTPVSVRQLFNRLKPIAWRYFLVLGLLRLGLVGLFAEFFVNRASTFDVVVEFWLIFGVCALAFSLRSMWPFAPEILGLELCPLGTKGNSKTITYFKRSRGLHSILMSDHIARFFGVSILGVLLFGSLIGLQLFLFGASTGNWQWNFWFDHVALPLTMWVVGLLMAVARFLCYLDCRIRLEGWEVELRLKAEASRMIEPVKVSSGGGVESSGDELTSNAVGGARSTRLARGLGSAATTAVAVGDSERQGN